jgi:hypothetical protein
MHIFTFTQAQSEQRMQNIDRFTHGFTKQWNATRRRFVFVTPASENKKIENNKTMQKKTAKIEDRDEPKHKSKITAAIKDQRLLFIELTCKSLGLTYWIASGCKLTHAFKVYGPTRCRNFYITGHYCFTSRHKNFKASKFFNAKLCLSIERN